MKVGQDGILLPIDNRHSWIATIVPLSRSAPQNAKKTGTGRIPSGRKMPSCSTKGPLVPTSTFKSRTLVLIPLPFGHPDMVESPRFILILTPS